MTTSSEQELRDKLSFEVYGQEYRDLQDSQKYLVDQLLALINEQVALTVEEALKDLSDKSDTHLTPIYGVTNRQIIEQIPESEPEREDQTDAPQ